MSRVIKQIIIHCSATPRHLNIGAKEIREMHVKQGWTDIGYHYVIRRDGKVELGRDLDKDGDIDEETGAHAFGWNANSIGICLIGGVGSTGKGDANFTKEQMIALAAFLVAKREEYPTAVVMGHRDTGAKKDCPSFDVATWLKTGVLTQPRNPN
jgi:N-acetyl-anhydromuramyl-L-alanine amidase AmpD